MRVLALDTATAATVAALTDPAASLALEARDDPPRGARPSHARALLGLVEDVLSRSGAGWEAVDRIAVGVGPGTFTGLRIGVATAQALARARAKPLLAVSTLRSLALAAAADAGPGEVLLAVIDARRGEAFAAAYRVGVELEERLAPCVLAPAALGDAVAQLDREGAGAVRAVGDGAIQFRDRLVSAGAAVAADDSPLHRVSALWHCRLAAGADAPAAAALNAIQPDYLRVPDAELKR